MYKYKNISDSVQTITASGSIDPRVVEAGQETVSEIVIENPNFEYVGEVSEQSQTDTVTDQTTNEETI